jgi:hypothetical protein
LHGGREKGEGEKGRRGEGEKGRGGEGFMVHGSWFMVYGLWIHLNSINLKEEL